MLTHERHRYAVSRALDEVRAFRERGRSAICPRRSRGCTCARRAVVLEDLIGAIDVEDVLDEVFRRFCVGK